MPRQYHMLAAQKHFLYILACMVTMTILLNMYGPPAGPMPPSPVLSQTFLTSNCEDGRRLGNLIFNYASMIGIASRYNMTIVMDPDFRLFEVFEISAHANDHLDNTLGLHEDFEEYGRRACAYDVAVEQMKKANTRLHGYFQSWKYFNHSQQKVRQELKFQEYIDKPARDFIRDSIKNYNFDNSNKVVIVGMHVRRGDYLDPYFSNYGYSTPDASYFEQARKYFTDKHKNVLFIVCSDDIQWCRKNIVGDNIVYSQTGSDVIDLAILSRCNHTIMSTGSFGWWGAWLAGGTTIYYSKWPRPVSVLEYMVTKPDFFYPDWIPLP